MAYLPGGLQDCCVCGNNPKANLSTPLDVIANRLQIGRVQLDKLPLNKHAIVRAIDWTAMPDGEGHRLRSLGLEEGVGIEALHKGILLWKDPIAVRVGRMTIALRRKVAAAITCEWQHD